jgi:4-carboxymuconolactone decarboxylase
VNEYDARMQRGLKMLKQLGREGGMMNHKEIYPDLYDLTVGHLFGDIWTRPHLSVRDRELITLTTVVVLAYANGTQSHLRSALHLGMTKEEIMEVLIQIGAYAGWPRLAQAVREFTKVLESEGATAGTPKKAAAKKGKVARAAR